ncbi:MAG: T9SS type A sorting domain-containing protein [Flavobacteriaceae bacterium]|nr:T9SS type A sorting domain-containing protein [Flavobacteriaceae bacterium]MDG1962533.1 T9SS type A sorting domain-containing protein [Flavobacteriaceae bacterium]
MKRLFILYALIWAAGAFSQCPSVTLVLDTQEAIDDFSLNYPNCTNFQETLIIEESMGLIENLAGLAPLTYIREFKVRATHIVNFEGLEDLETIEYLEVINNSDLINFAGLESVSRVDILIVSYNPSLTALTGFNGLSEADVLNLFDNGALSNIQSLAGLQSLASLSIAGNQIQSLEGLENITAISEQIFIANEQVATLNALSSLTNFTGSLYFWNNSQLNDFTAFEGVTQLENLLVVACDQVQNLAGFGALETIENVFRFGFNPQLNSLAVFDHLQSVGSLDIYENDLLESLEGLEQLTEIRGNVYLLDNPSLSDISALDAAQSIGVSEVVIARNPNLAVCDNAFVCSVLFDPDIPEEIQSNANGCNSVPQVAARCILTDEAFGDVLVSSIAPNPVRKLLTIDLNPSADLVSVKIMHPDGRQILTSKQTSVDLSFLPVGLFLVVVETTFGTIVKKVIKH